MRRFDRSIVLGELAPIRGEMRPVNRTALDLARGEFTIPQAAKPFISPLGLIWQGLPGEETTVSRLFFARTSDVEPDETLSCDTPNSTAIGPGAPWIWMEYVLRALHDAKGWYLGSGVWGCTEWRAMTAVNAILDEWIEIATKTTAIAARQIMVTPSGAFADQIRSVEDFGRTAIITRSRTGTRPGMSQRWPIEVYTVSKALLLELKWARKTFGYLAGVIKDFVDCQDPVGAVGRTPCGSVIAQSGFRGADTYARYQAALTYLSGAAGRIDYEGILHKVQEYNDMVEFVAQVGGFFEEYQGLQDLVVSTIREVVASMNAALSRAADDIRTFAGTISDTVPIVGLMVQVAAGMAVAMLDQAARDAAGRAERGVPALYRGVDADGASLALRRTDIETWMLMMFRALRLQEVRVLALVDGTSPLPGALHTKAVGEAVPPAAPPPPEVRPQGLSGRAKVALAVGGGASAAGLVWWLVKRFGRTR